MSRPVFVFFLLYLLIIPALHVVPTGNLGIGGPSIGPVRATHFLHAAMFLPWGIIAAYYVFRRPEGTLRRAFGWIAVGLALAAGAEGVQHWLPYRSFTLLDLSFNVAGVLIGSLVLLVWRPQKALLRRNLERIDREYCGGDRAREDRHFSRAT